MPQVKPVSGAVQAVATSALRAQQARMRIIANRRAVASKAQFVNDVRVRKLTIAEGEGVVHGIHYNLEEQFALRLA